MGGIEVNGREYNFGVKNAFKSKEYILSY